jgi:hypothetical protein
MCRRSSSLSKADVICGAEEIMNWKVLIACAVSAFTLAGCGSTIEPNQNASKVATLSTTQNFSSIGQELTLDGTGYYNVSLSIFSNITDTWYDSVSTAIKICGKKLGRADNCQIRVYNTYTSYPSTGGYFVCRVTDGSTSISISAANYSPIVYATTQASATLSNGADDFGPRPPSYSSCN